ncbi:MAG: hypothetical protein IPM79_33970 [Polyangiaceae bacterium]|jgi:hypothetical protein|nr:hypothetical protein [Polyangiaceae bacterium]MBK8942473.1 hypothetical protein [Polyangiaceae bacterium]
MKRSTTTSLASLQRWAAALGVAASLSGAACKPEATSDAPSSSSAAVSSTAPATQVVSAPPSASAATPAPKPWAKAIKRDLELRLGNAKLGEINIEWTPTASGFRSTVKSWIAMKVTTNDGAVSRSENDEEEAYDAHGQLLTSTKIDRENGVEEREEVSIADGKLRAKVKKPSHEDDRTLLLPPDFDNEILVFTKLREAVLGGAAMPRAASYASFDTDDMDFERKILRIVGKTTIETPDGKIDGWQIEEVDVKSGDVVKGVADDAGFPLRVEFGAFTAVIKGTPGGGDMAEIDSNVPIEGSYKEGVSELLVEVTVKGDSGTDPGIFVESPYQKVARSGDVYSLTLLPRRASAGLTAATLPMKDLPADISKYLGPTAMSQSTDPEIVARAKEIVGAEGDSKLAARKIVAWVNKNLAKKDGTRGAASAVETMKSKHGDCTEHTALVVALARAAGIPARSASGIVLIPGTKIQGGYHAWPELWIGEWVVMDAALGTLDVGPSYLWLGYSEPGEPNKGSKLSRLVGRTKLVVK